MNLVDNPRVGSARRGGIVALDAAEGETLCMTVQVVLMRSMAETTRNSSSLVPPSVLVCELLMERGGDQVALRMRLGKEVARELLL